MHNDIKSPRPEYCAYAYGVGDGNGDHYAGNAEECGCDRVLLLVVTYRGDDCGG